MNSLTVSLKTINLANSKFSQIQWASNSGSSECTTNACDAFHTCTFFKLLFLEYWCWPADYISRLDGTKSCSFIAVPRGDDFGQYSYRIHTSFSPVIIRLSLLRLSLPPCRTRRASRRGIAAIVREFSLIWCECNATDLLPCLI